MARGGRLAEHDQGRLKGPFTAAEGRKFGVTVGLAFLLLAALFLWKSREIPLYVTATMGTALLIGGLVAPASLGPVYRGWMRFALALSKITTPIVMSVIYFVVITPFGVVRRSFGKNPLRHEADGGTYWKTRDPKIKRDLRRQF